MSRPNPPQQLRRQQSRADLALALLLGAAAVFITASFGEPWSDEDNDVDLWGVILVALAFAPLAFRRRWPVLVLGITTAAATVYLLFGYPYGPILFAFFIVVYTVASLLPLTTAAISVTVALLFLITHVFVHPAAQADLGLIPGSAWAVVPFAIGTSVRSARQTRETARAEAVRQQLYEERIRLAQEVHDIVGHGLAAIQMQADVALHVDEQQSPRTRSALEAISRASSDAFEELRSTLDVISDHRNATRAPAPGLGDLEDLCDRIRAAGVSVDFSVEGEQPEVSLAVGLAVYRIVQESLTNVIRHGSVPSATVHVTFEAYAIDLRVSNPGPVSVDSGSGHGISGMGRRVDALGGTFEAGPSDHGFEVHVRIPVGRAR